MEYGIVSTALWAFSILSLLGPAAMRAPSGGSKPRLAQGLDSMYTVDPSENPLFAKCRFTGFPRPVVTWDLNGSRIPDSANLPEQGPYYITTNGTLVLSGAKPSHSGTYTCTGTNSFGTASVSTFIYIVESDGTPLWSVWWMWFVYCFAAWLLFVMLLVCRICIIPDSSKKRTKPVDRNECFAIDHELHHATTSQMQSPGYRNATFGTQGGAQMNSRLTELTGVESNDTDGAAQTTNIRSSAYFDPDSPTTPLNIATASILRDEQHSSGRRKKENAAFVDTKLQLVLVEEQPIAPQMITVGDVTEGSMNRQYDLLQHHSALTLSLPGSVENVDSTSDEQAIDDVFT